MRATSVSTYSVTANKTRIMELCDVLNVMYISKSTRWILGALNIATSVIAATGNFVIIVVITSRKRLRTRPNSLICCLAMTDLAVGLIMQPIVSTQLYNENAGRNCTITYILYGIGTLICGASSLILSLISYDRYLHLVKLQNYTKYMPKWKIKLLLVLCWVIPAINGCLVFDESTRAVMHILSVIALALCTAAIAIWNKKIYKFISNRSKVLPFPTKRGSRIAEQLHAKRQARLAITLFIIVGCFIICWMPFSAYTIYAMVYKMQGDTVCKSGAYANTVHCISLTFGLCNSSLNPVIFFSRNKNFRAEAKKLTRSLLFELLNCND